MWTFPDPFSVLRNHLEIIIVDGILGTMWYDLLLLNEDQGESKMLEWDAMMQPAGGRAKADTYISGLPGSLLANRAGLKNIF